MKEIDRITQDPNVMGGKACIRGMRVTVGAIVGLIGSGYTVEQVLADHPCLEREGLLSINELARRRAQSAAPRRIKLPKTPREHRLQVAPAVDDQA